MTDTCILILPSVHEVMKAEKLLLDAGCSVNVIATPREISHNCGVALQFECNSLPTIAHIIQHLSIEKKVFRVNNGKYYEITLM